MDVNSGQALTSRHFTAIVVVMSQNLRRIVVLVPAHNEQESIRDTITALTTQTREPDLIVVIPNGCTDRTAEIAREYPVEVFELPRLPHGKSEALNLAWHKYAADAFMVVTVDADTVLVPNAVSDWETEMLANPKLAGSSSKFTMQQPGILSRLQKAEFATWTQTALNRKSTHVLAGTGCAIRGSALREVADMPDREGPWSYQSATEDFEITYQIRRLGGKCHVSPTVRAYTDSMRTVRALWGQRLKWQVGTIEDLLRVGVNRLTLRDWWQQALGLLNALLKLLWIYVIFGAIIIGVFQFIWFWWCVPIVFAAVEAKRALRIPHRDRKDMWLAGAFIFYEMFSWMRSAWFVVSWFAVIRTRVTGVRVDRWQAQYVAEGV